MVFDQSSATVDLAATAVGCEPARIAKTLSFNVNGQAILIVTAGDVRIDNPKFNAQFGVKAKMLTPDDAVIKIGFAVGGVCPFAVNDDVVIYLDESLKRFKGATQTIHRASLQCWHLRSRLNYPSIKRGTCLNVLGLHFRAAENLTLLWSILSRTGSTTFSRLTKCCSAMISHCWEDNYYGC